MAEKKKTCIGVCCSHSCGYYGADRIVETLEKEYDLKVGESNDTTELEWTGCLGYCESPVNIEVDGEVVVEVSPENVVQRIKDAQDGNAHTPQKASPQQVEDGIDEEFANNFLGDF
jgi:NADH:ubiquinone oxidoreductase subunit E